VINVKSLTKKIDSVLAVDNISFECAKGEVCGLLGANGAGKTSTMRMLATILKPTSGTAVVNGFDVVTNSIDVRRNIGVLSGEMGLYSRLTAEENINYFGQLYGLTQQYVKLRINELFSLLDMQEYRSRRTEGFSKGMKQKVNIVRAIIHDPPILLLDEPTSGLDVISSRTVLEFIKKGRTEGKCILFATHIMAEAEELCDRIIIMNKGAIVAQGTLAELCEITGKRTLEEAFIRLVGVR